MAYKNIFEAIRANDIEAVKTFLPCQLKLRDRGDSTPLHYACAYGYTEIARLLLDGGADIEAKNYNNETPLYPACINDHIKTINFLLDRGADINASGYKGNKLMHSMCRIGNIETVRLLLDRGADINIRDTNGDTLLHIACRNANIKFAFLLLLLNNGIDIEARSTEGWTPLHYACNYGNHAVSEFLVAHGADPFAKNNKGISALEYDTFDADGKINNESPHKKILVRLRAEYLNRPELDKSERTAVITSGWEMEM